MIESVIEVKSLSKKFCSNMKKSMIYGSIDLARSIIGLNVKTDFLRQNEFWALSDINFNVNKGEVLGILGQNGSGKSTLLRIINGIFPPDSGEILIKGRMGSLIALGAGFHPHMTGLENIFLNGSILGLSREQIDERLESIIEFADIGDFLNAPVSTYSSGMTVRLGFSIAIHSIPEILIVDEVLAVGDYNFQRKCYDKILELKEKGTSILLVTHSISTVERMCDRGLVLNKGRQVFLGRTSEAIQAYGSICSDATNTPSALVNDTPSTGYGIGNVRVFNAKAYQVGREQSEEIEFGSDFVIEFEYEFKNKESKNYEVRLGIRTPEGRDIQLISFHEGKFADGRAYDKRQYVELKNKGKIKVRVSNQHYFPQNFKVDISFARMDRDYHEGGLANAVILRIRPKPDTNRYFEPGSMMVTHFDTEIVENI